MKFVDTTFLVDLLRKRISQDKIEKLSKERIYASEISFFELVAGIYERDFPDEMKRKRIKETIEKLGFITFISVSQKEAAVAGEIAGNLLRKGQQIEDTDFLIAGTALANGVTTIATRNKDHFKRIPGLKVETY